MMIKANNENHILIYTSKFHLTTKACNTELRFFIYFFFQNVLVKRVVFKIRYVGLVIVTFRIKLTVVMLYVKIHIQHTETTVMLGSCRCQELEKGNQQNMFIISL